MSHGQSFPQGPAPVGAGIGELGTEAFSGLVPVVESYRRALAEARAGELQVRRRQLIEIARAEDRIRECLHPLDWSAPASDRGPGPHPAPAPISEPVVRLRTVDPPGRDAGAARDLARSVAVAERASAALLARLTRSGAQAAPQGAAGRAALPRTAGGRAATGRGGAGRPPRGAR